MIKPEEKIEQFLNSSVSRVIPPRALFNGIMESVTNTESDRYPNKKAKVLSDYQLTPYFFMKKLVYIGVPLAIVAIIAVVAVKRPMVATQDTNNTNQKMADQNTGTPQNGTNSGNTNPANVANQDNSTVDSIAAGIISDINADSASVSQESDEDAALLNGLQDYNNLKTVDYENNI